MRLARIVFALVVGLALAGPETHACPVHNAAPAEHHHETGQHQESAPCTCPQECGPTTAPASVPAASDGWTATPGPVLAVAIEAFHAVALPSRKHFLPFALAPPHRA